MPKSRPNHCQKGLDHPYGPTFSASTACLASSSSIAFSSAAAFASSNSSTSNSTASSVASWPHVKAFT